MNSWDAWELPPDLNHVWVPYPPLRRLWHRLLGRPTGRYVGFRDAVWIEGYRILDT